jgi:exopolyphosphatase/guanosine-5'-triphosphate,3'-diphosphate pyrophosphatase
LESEAASAATPVFPIRLGCVDTGSNAIRFMVADLFSPTRFETLVSERVPVRLGHQVFLNGRLANSTMDAAVEAFASFRETMDRLEVRSHRAVATSAVREAANGDLLVERIARETGIRLEVITGTEEARLVHLAVASRIDLSGRQWILVDLGGGSVEVSLADDAGMLWSQSHTMGSVRLLEELTSSGDDPGRFRALLTEYVSVLRIPAPSQYWQPSGFIATGGNIEALAFLAAATPDDEGVSRLPVSDLRSSIDHLARLSFRERVKELELREDRADVILPAAMVYLRLAELADAPEILAPHVGVKEGILLDLMDDLVFHRSHEERQSAQVTQAAVSLGRRYMFDEAHGLHVARLAGDLFDQLADLHGLEEQDRRYLVAAAVLHDVGMFVAPKKHHKHSLYLISRSELPGLSEDEMQIVANVARYHRRRAPAPHHGDFMALGKGDRVRVTQLAALLRIADALDRQHIQSVDSVSSRVEGRELHLRIDGSGDMLLERWAVTRKAGLFEDTFGLKVRITG